MEMEQVGRNLLSLMQGVHQCSTADGGSDLCQKADGMFLSAREHVEMLKRVVPNGSYYQFHDQWRFVLQRLSFLTSLLHYMRTGQLASRGDVAAALGVCVSQDEGFHLDIDDYLMGVLCLANELSRLAVNSVIVGDFQRPFAIAELLTTISSGFRLLNLKNDALRKRFDGLKYDVSKVEEVVYDLTVRGLKPQSGEKRPAP